jgi:hypothetical protein
LLLTLLLHTPLLPVVTATSDSAGTCVMQGAACLGMRETLATRCARGLIRASLLRLQTADSLPLALANLLILTRYTSACALSACSSTNNGPMTCAEAAVHKCMSLQGMCTGLRRVTGLRLLLTWDRKSPHARMTITEP